MENHVHLLVCDRENNLSLFMKRLVGNYALWFNRKYQCTGHLFEQRYTCIPIESEDRLLIVFRYILNNPREAGICPASEYPWSSYNRYGSPNSFVDTSIFAEFLKDYDTYASFISDKYEDVEFLYQKHDDEWAKSVLQKKLKIQTGKEIQSYEKKERNEAILKLRENGLSIRQIERLTGISKGAIQRIIKME